MTSRRPGSPASTGHAPALVHAAAASRHSSGGSSSDTNSPSASDRIECVDTKASGRMSLCASDAPPSSAVVLATRRRTRNPPPASGSADDSAYPSRRSKVNGVRTASPRAARVRDARLGQLNGSLGGVEPGSQTADRRPARRRLARRQLKKANGDRQVRAPVALHQALGARLPAVALIGALDGRSGRQHAKIEAAPVLHRAGAIGIERVALVEHGVGDRPRRVRRSWRHRSRRRRPRAGGCRSPGPTSPTHDDVCGPPASRTRPGGCGATHYWDSSGPSSRVQTCTGSR